MKRHQPTAIKRREAPPIQLTEGPGTSTNHTMRPSLARLLALSSKYKLVEAPCPSPTITSTNTMCQCRFPIFKPINRSKPLYGTKAGTWKHAFVHSSVPAVDWKPKVEMMPTELVSTLSRFKRSDTDPMYPVGISNVELTKPGDVPDEYNVMVFPDNVYYAVNEDNAQQFLREVLNPEGTQVFLPSMSNSSRVMMICGHTQRDKRCGIVAPGLKAEFEYNLSERGMLYSEDNPTGVRVGIVSHIGGHAYAGNVLYYDEDGLGIWYGRCENRHVDGIVEETVIKKNIIKELFRGRYD